MAEQQRRHFSSQKKVKILREHFLERTPISEVCQKYQIQPSLFYNRQKTFFENGTAAFERQPSRSAGEISSGVRKTKLVFAVAISINASIFSDGEVVEGGPSEPKIASL